MLILSKTVFHVIKIIRCDFKFGADMNRPRSGVRFTESHFTEWMFYRVDIKVLLNGWFIGKISTWWIFLSMKFPVKTSIRLAFGVTSGYSTAILEGCALAKDYIILRKVMTKCPVVRPLDNWVDADWLPPLHKNFNKASAGVLIFC